jgi:hypothetical protein
MLQPGSPGSPVVYQREERTKFMLPGRIAVRKRTKGMIHRLEGNVRPVLPEMLDGPGL